MTVSHAQSKAQVVWRRSQAGLVCLTASAWVLLSWVRAQSPALLSRSCRADEPERHQTGRAVPGSRGVDPSSQSPPGLRLAALGMNVVLFASPSSSSLKKKNTQQPKRGFFGNLALRPPRGFLIFLSCCDNTSRFHSARRGTEPAVLCQPQLSSSPRDSGSGWGGTEQHPWSTAWAGAAPFGTQGARSP